MFCVINKYMSLRNCRKEQSNDALNSLANRFSDAELSEEMLAMLYCMAIMR